MAEPEEVRTIPEPLRREIFLALVTAQDSRMTVSESRKQVRARFQLTEGQLLEIEREGMDNDWPPL